MRNFKLAMLNIKKNFQNAKELRSAFITSIVGMCINNTAFIYLWINFGAAVGDINGWGKYDIIGLNGFCAISYGIVFSFFYGIGNIPRYISSGNLDKYLLTPKNTLLKIATSAVSTSAIGDLIFGLICCVLYIFLVNLSLVQVLLSLVFIITTSIIFFAFTLISVSLSFYFMEGDNISNGVFQIFLTPSLYHGGAFNKVLRIIFTFVIPALLVGAIPVEILKDISLLKIFGVLGLSIFWLAVSILFFYKSLKRYESNNFFGFGG